MVGALYGLKTSPRDYLAEVTRRLTSMGYQRLALSDCIYTKTVDEDNTIIVHAYVDDFIITGSSDAVILTQFVTPFRQHARTTEPIIQPTRLLGMEITYLPNHHICLIKVAGRIQALADEFGVSQRSRKRDTPMPVAGYLVCDEDFLNITPEESIYLTKQQRHAYMAIVGALIWIAGVRPDITFSVMYLSWFTQSPRQHHHNMAMHVVTYLWSTMDLPLVLGGANAAQLTAYTDSSLATGPKRRSISGSMAKLHPSAGSIITKSQATQGVRLNTFEAELDAATTGFKTLQYITHLMEELHMPTHKTSHLYVDNMAMMEFIKHQGTATGVRYMDLRLWYTRELYMAGKVDIMHMPGTEIPANYLTKLATGEEHKKFTFSVLGHQLLPQDLL